MIIIIENANIFQQKEFLNKKMLHLFTSVNYINLKGQRSMYRKFLPFTRLFYFQSLYIYFFLSVGINLYFFQFYYYS